MFVGNSVFVFLILRNKKKILRSLKYNNIIINIIVIIIWIKWNNKVKINLIFNVLPRGIWFYKFFKGAKKVIFKAEL